MKKTTRTPESKCLQCGIIIDAATDPLTGKEPSKGQISVCIKCGHVMTYDKDLKLAELTAKDWVDIGKDAKAMQFITIAKSHIKARNFFRAQENKN